MAFAISRMLVAFISTQQNQVSLDLGMDWRVLAFTTALAALTTVSFGLAPALRSTRAEPATLSGFAGARAVKSGTSKHVTYCSADESPAAASGNAILAHQESLL